MKSSRPALSPSRSVPPPPPQRRPAGPPPAPYRAKPALPREQWGLAPQGLRGMGAPSVGYDQTVAFLPPPQPPPAARRSFPRTQDPAAPTLAHEPAAPPLAHEPAAPTLAHELASSVRSSELMRRPLRVAEAIDVLLQLCEALESQRRSDDAREEVFVLACLLYELLTGAPAFPGSPSAAGSRGDDPLPPSSLRRDVDIPLDLDRVVLDALVERSAACATASELARALRPHASGQGQRVIAGLAAEPPSLPGAAAPFDENTDDSMTMVQSLIPSEPGLSSPPRLPARAEMGRHPLAQVAAMLPPAPAHLPTVPPMRWRTWSQRSEGGLRLKAGALGLAALAATIAGVLLLPAEGLDAHAQAGLTALPVAGAQAAIDHQGASAAKRHEAPARTPAKPAVAAKAKDDAPKAEAPKDDAPKAEAPKAEAPKAETAGTPKAEAPKAKDVAVKATQVQPPKTDSRSAKPAKPATSEPQNGTGTLVAMAIGETCAFAVDGAPKGTRSNVRVEVGLGTHTVTCQPQKGALRSRTVTVKPDQAAVAVFKF